MKTIPTKIPIKPFETNALPVTQYDRFTIDRIDVGDSGISTCTLKIGEKEFVFLVCNSKQKDILVVNGGLNKPPTVAIQPNLQNMVSLSLPHPQEFYQNGNPLNIQLWGYLHFSDTLPMV